MTCVYLNQLGLTVEQIDRKDALIIDRMSDEYIRIQFPFVVNDVDIDAFKERSFSEHNISVALRICVYLNTIHIRNTTRFLLAHINLHDDRMCDIIHNQLIECNHRIVFEEARDIFDTMICATIARNFDELTRIHSVLKCPVSKYQVDAAIKQNDLDMVRYLHSFGNIVWSKTSYENAALTKNIPMLQYLHSNSCPWGQDYGEAYVSSITNPDMFDVFAFFTKSLDLPHRGLYYEQNLIRTLTHDSKLAYLKYVFHNNLYLTNVIWRCIDTMQVAAKNGQLQCVIFLHETDCRMSSLAITFAFQNGRFDVLKYLCSFENRQICWEDCAKIINENKTCGACIEYMKDLSKVDTNSTYCHDIRRNLLPRDVLRKNGIFLT